MAGARNGKAKKAGADDPLPADERTGDVVHDVRVSTREHPDGKSVRLCLRRGGTPVALTPDEAEAVASLLVEAARNSR